MTVPNPRTWIDGEIVTPTMMNTEIRDAFDFILARPRAAVACGSGQSIPGGTDTPVQWDTLLRDNDGMWSAGTNTRLTIQTSGLYIVSFQCGFQGNNSGYRAGEINVNGSGVYGLRTEVHVQSSAAIVMNGTGFADLSAGDYIELVVTQNSGGSLGLSTNLQYQPTMGLAWLGNS